MCEERLQNMREQLECLCTTAFLAYHSVFDWKDKQIPGRSLGIGVAVSGCWALGKALLGQQTWLAFVLGLIPGVAMLLLAGITRQQIGYGDGWELLIMGNWLGLADCLLGLGVAFLGVFIVCVVLLVGRKVRRNTEIPFVPFLCIGTVAVTLLHFMR